MKNYFLISIFFWVLHFVSYSQKIDSSSRKAFDSTIVKKQFINKIKSGNEEARHSYYAYTMNGKIISDSVLGNLLSLFKSSESEYKKSKKWKLASRITFPIVISVSYIELFRVVYFGVGATLGGSEIDAKKSNNAATTFSIATGVGISAGITMSIIKRHHLKKAVKLYNEEILKRNK